MAWQDRYKEERIVVQQSAGHNKFWAAHYDDSTGIAHIRWGRLGTKGQSQEKHFGSNYAAANFIDNKFYEKQRKGYTDKDAHGNKIDHARFEAMCIEAAIVGTSNKCHELQWVEFADDNSFTHIDEDRLFNPACNPGLLVNFETRIKYDGRNRFKFVFAADKTFDVQDANYIITRQIVTSSHPLYKLTQKVEEAIGRKLS